MAQTARSNEAEKATDNVAAIAGRTGDNLAAISNRTADKAADATREATERTQDAARRGSQAAQRTTAGATEVGRAFAELVREQSRDNVAAFRSLTDTFWDHAARVQADLLRASLERSAEFTRRYLEVVRAVTASAVSATKEQARKAG